MSRSRHLLFLAPALFALALAGCGGGDDDDGGGGGGGNNQTFTVGGTLTGLTGTVVLQNNGGNNLSVSANGNFTFSTAVNSGAAYSVTVLTQPAGQTCTVTSGAGNANANVTNVAVNCTTNPTFTIGGALSGVTGTLVLQNNGGNNLSLTTNGNFTFTTAVASGAAYNVTVLTQPAGQTCLVTNGAGNANANVTNVTVNCTTNQVSVTIGGTVTGLTAGTLVLQNNLGDNFLITSDGAFTFPTVIAVNAPYFVSSFVQPQGQLCSVANGSGASATNVTNVQVTCAPIPSTVTIGGTVSGLVGGGTFTLRLAAVLSGVITNTDLPVSANGAFTFAPTAGGSFFTVTAISQPAGQTCSVTNNAGGAVGNFTFVVVACENGTIRRTVGGTISGLTRGGLVLGINANNQLQGIAANTTQFTFPNGFTPGTEYMANIAAQPPGMTCVLRNGDGRVDAANVTDLAIVCIVNATDPLIGTYTIVSQTNYLTLYPDGQYVLASRENDPACGASNGNGVELGVYNYDDTTGNFQVLSNVIDTNDDCGLWDGSGLSGTVTKTGVGQGARITFNDGSEDFQLVPAASVANSFIGSFRQPGTTGFVVLSTDGHYTVAHTGNDSAGIEYGCYTLTGAASGNFTPNPTCPGSVDTNDDAGFSDNPGVAFPYTALTPYLVQAFDRILLRIVPN